MMACAGLGDSPGPQPSGEADRRSTKAAQEPSFDFSTARRCLGERIRRRRKELGISQERLADRSDVHWTFVGQVERGQRNLSLHNLLKLAQGLDLDAGALVQRLRPSLLDIQE